MSEQEAQPAEVVTAATNDQAEEPADDEPREGREEAAAVTCQHCGEEVEGVEAETDFLCPHCERYQDSAICPTCHQVARASLMEAGA